MSFQGNIIDDHIESRFLQEKVLFKTYLPNNFSPLYTYQLLIVQDGDDYLQKGKLASLVSSLLEKKQIREVIIVMIPYQSVEDRSEKYHPNGSKNRQYIRFLAEELVPHLEQKYHTFELASGRTLLGESLGGTVSLHAASEYPFTFGQVIAQSPYIHKKTIEAFSTLKPELLRLYVEVGLDETEVVTTKGKAKNFLDQNREFSKLLKEKGIEVFYEEFNGDHTWTFWQQNLTKALVTMLK